MVRAVVEHFTYVGIFTLLLGASLGLPVPEEAPIVAAGVLSGQHLVRWWIALPVCLLGALSGDVVLYWVGHHWGERILEWAPVRRVLSDVREEALRASYRQHGVKILFTARHVMGLRAAAFLTAGIAGVRFGRFLAADAAAAALGVPISFGLAYLFADRIERVLADVHHVEHWVVLLLVTALAGWLGARAWRRARRPQGGI